MWLMLCNLSVNECTGVVNNTGLRGGLMLFHCSDPVLARNKINNDRKEKGN